MASGEVAPSSANHAASAIRFAPDGVSTIAIESWRTERHPVITNSGGSEFDLGIHDGGRYASSRGLDWAGNDTILVPEFISGGLLLTVTHHP